VWDVSPTTAFALVSLRKLVHLSSIVIAGNPKSGRRIATLAIVLLAAIVVVLTLVGLRKRNSPVNHQPLHPTTVISQVGNYSASRIRGQLPQS
jgi:hypothetical protein